MSERYDVIVVGGGHNGLTAAAMLARLGRKVVLVERRDVVGGMCAGEEFHAGYRSPGLLHDTACVRPAIADALSLHEHGLEFLDGPVSYFTPQQEGDGLLLHHDVDAAATELAKQSDKAAEAYRKFRDFTHKVRRVVEPTLNEPPIDLVSLTTVHMVNMLKHGLSMRRLGGRDMMELLRVPPMCVADWTREWFDSELVCAALAGRALEGTWCGPWSPGTASNLLVWECTARRSVKGGAAALAHSLERAARHFGVEIRCGDAVESIRVKNNQVLGVKLAGGETIDAAAVASSCDPKTTFLELLDPRHVAHKLDTNVRAFRQRGTTAKVNLALNGPLKFSCRPELAVEHARTGETLDDQERAFDAVKYRQMSERPLLDIHVPTVSNPDMAPAGHAVASILVHFAPYALEGGWNDTARERLGDLVVAELERYAPGVSSTIVAREVLTPADIEQRYGATGGHIHHGEHSIDQWITRPTLETSGYSTPIAGLYLCGSGSHPGGGVTCSPGGLAAKVIAS